MILKRRSKEYKGDKTFKQFESFKRRINSSKHAFWFELLHDSKKFNLFLDWRKKKRDLNKENISLRKFIFEIRKTKKYRVPPSLLRDNAINKILNQ